MSNTVAIFRLTDNENKEEDNCFRPLLKFLLFGDINTFFGDSVHEFSNPPVVLMAKV